MKTFQLLLFIVLHAFLGAHGAITKSKEKQDLCRRRLYSPENGQIKELLEEKPGVFAATFQCNSGYRLVGKSRIVCRGNGEWLESVPLCKSLCSYVTCGDGRKCILDDVFSTTKCVCKNIFECPFEYKPICGSDHVTYANKCIMGMNMCRNGKQINLLAEKPCPKGIFEDGSCSECPKIRICQALYSSEYAFLGELFKLNETDEGVYLHFDVEETYKGIETESGIKTITLLKKQDQHDCNCTPFIPSGKSYVFGKFSKVTEKDVMAFDERTFVEKFSSHEQMSLCWLY